MRLVVLALLLSACQPSAPPSPVSNRTIVVRPLMPTSPQNLLRDPFIGGDGSPSWGQFRAYFENGANMPLTRTFQSESPVGGAVSVEELRDIPAPSGATKARVTAPFLGSAGSFHASIWISAGDRQTTPQPFSTAASVITVTLLGNDGKAVTTLVASSPVTYGRREWVKFETAGDTALPRGGWLSVELANFDVSLQLAAPEVTVGG